MNPDPLEDLQVDEDLLPVQEAIRKPVKHLRKTKSIRPGGIRGFIQPDDYWYDMPAFVFVYDPKGDHIYTPLEPIDTSEQRIKLDRISKKGMYRGRLWSPPWRKGKWEMQNGVRTYRSPRDARIASFLNKKAPLPIGGVSKYRRLQNRHAYWELSSKIYDAQKEDRHPRLTALYNATDRVEILSKSYYPAAKQRLVRWRGPIPEFLIQPLYPNEPKI